MWKAGVRPTLRVIPMNPTPKRLILNMLMASEDGCMSARDAINACRLFGVRENTARVTLVRLAGAGMIESAGRGAYRLGGAAAGLAQDVARWRNAEHHVSDWSGAWIAVHVGGLPRSDRTVMRARERALFLLGLREHSPGLWLRPDNLVGGVEGARARLYALGLDQDASVFLAERLDERQEQRARSLWDGAVLNASYREMRTRLDEWLARADELELDAAAREVFLLGDKAIRQMVYDPLLPAPLVDVTARQAFFAALLHFDEAGHAIWRRLQLTNDETRAAARPTPDGTRTSTRTRH
jgi:phenylacetic acid degradation operon negative regulatory protein